MAQGSVRARAAGWARLSATIGLIAIAGACTTPAKPPAPPPVAEAPPPTPVVSPPQALGARDTCGADPLQYLIGRPRTDIPVPVNPNLRRVVCSSCMVTQDYVAARQTIVYDSQTGLVRSVRCG
jgi:hypothetical protein